MIPHKYPDEKAPIRRWIYDALYSAYNLQPNGVYTKIDYSTGVKAYCLSTFPNDTYHYLRTGKGKIVQLPPFIGEGAVEIAYRFFVDSFPKYEEIE